MRGLTRSIFGKILSGFVGLIIGFALLTSYFTYHELRSSTIENLRSQLSDLNLALTHTTSYYLERNNLPKLQDYIEQYANKTGIRITIIKKKGTVIADTEEDPQVMDDHSSRPEIISAQEKGEGTSLRFSNTTKKEMLYVANPISIDNKLYTLRTSIFLKDIERLMQSLNKDLFKDTLLLSLLAIAVSLYIARRLSLPIKRMATAAKKVSEGDLSTKVKVDSNDDLRLLADNFNEMTERVNDLFNEVKRRKEELRSIISSLKEGILVLGINGKIKLCNRAFRDEFATDANSEEDLRKIPYENIFAPSEKIARMIKNTLETKNGNTKELSYNNKDYLISTVFIPARKEVSVTFHNITEMKRLNELKKDFVTNASHELKTPLTSLKGYLETMATDQELNNEQQRYIQIMNRNTLRMINLVDDLLILSELEQKTDLQLEKIDLAEVVEETVSLFNENAQAKDIIIENQLVKDHFIIKGDYFKLEQVFINLIDNSIKYSESGTIKISATLEDNKVILKIADCGIGIPDDVKDRIFERFFVVNKSRSRESGGTGLGLSIVKHIIQSHQGTIFVEDNQPRGTIFKIILPLAT